LGEREDLLAALRARLEQANASEDFAAVLEPGAVAEGRRLYEIAREDLEVLCTIGWVHWYRYHGQPEGQDQEDFGISVRALTHCFVHGVDDLPDALLPLLAQESVPVAGAWLAESLRGGGADRDLILATARAWQRIVDCVPPEHRDGPRYLCDYGLALFLWFEQTGERADVDAAIDATRAALAIAPVGFPDADRAVVLSNLCMGLRARARLAGSAADLEEAIEVGRAAMAAAPAGHPSRARHLHNLGMALQDRFTRAGAAADLDGAIEAYQASVSDPGVDPVARELTMSLLGVALQARFSRDNALSTLNAAVEAYRAALADGVGGRVNRPAVLGSLGIVLAKRFGRARDPADLDAAIEAFRQSASGRPAGDPLSIDSLFNLGIALHDRYSRTAAPADLDAMIEANRQAAAIAPEGHPVLPEILSNLGMALCSRFEQTGAPADLDAAISASERAVAIAGDKTIVQSTLNLAVALKHRSSRTGDPADLDAAIDAERAAMAMAPASHPSWAAARLNLGVSLWTRFQRTDTLADLEASVELSLEAAGAVPPGHPDRPRLLSNLSSAYLSRHTRLGDMADLDAAVKTAQEAADTAPPGDNSRRFYLSNLGHALATRFKRTGRLADVDKALEATRAALASTPPDSPDRALCLSGLGNQLRSRFEWTGDARDLDAAIEAGNAAAQAAAAGSPSRATILCELAVALCLRFYQAGSQADLDGAVEASRAAVAVAVPGHVDRGLYLGMLGDALRMRFGQRGALADIDAAIDAMQAAVAAAPEGHGNHAAYLAGLCGAARDRFWRTGEAADLDTAIEAGQAAVDAAMPGHPYRALIMSVLGNLLQLRFIRTGVQADLDVAIEMTQAAVDGAPAGHLAREQALVMAASARYVRFGSTGARDDIDAAVQFLRDALDVAPPGPIQASRLLGLGVTLYLRYQLTGLPADQEAAAAAAAAAAAMTVSPPSYRIQAAALGAAIAAASDPSQAADLLELAVRLLPATASIRLARDDRQFALDNLAGLASEAAALALNNMADGASSEQRAIRALRLLEAGRAVLLSQALDTRSDLTDLRQLHPDLARRFTELRDVLDQPAEDTAGPVGLTLGAARATSDGARPVARDRQKLADEFTEVQEQIRRLDGFSSFGLPPSVGELLAEASDGPVVAFSTSGFRCDALLLTADGIKAAELPDLTLEDLTNKATSFHQALRAVTSPEGPPDGPDNPQETLLRVLAWLWDTVAEPVLRVLGYDREPRPGEQWPRVWWAPGGLLGLLPLHAAGHHLDQPGEHGRATVMDRVVSSYTPTVRALRYSREHARATAIPGSPGSRSLIVAMPTTPGIPGGALPGVTGEVGLVRDLLPDPVVLSEPDPGAHPGAAPDQIPTKANVLARLSGCAVAHFACHGASDLANPARSRLLLHDHETDPLTVASLAPVNLASARLAYLSACQTAAVPANGLMDEAIQLVTAFQLAGFPGVVGTLWEIGDTAATTIASKFYTRLRTSQGTLDTSGAARALHRAVRDQRDRYPRQPFLWAGYVYAGT
jgi:hypothetical protein